MIESNSETSGHGSTQEKIIAAATEEFAALGLAGARVDRIASRAGVNKAMIYYHYSSKENLYLAVIENLLARVSDRLQSAAESAVDLPQLMRALVSTYREIFRDQPELKAIILREMANPVDRILNQVASILMGTGLPSRLRAEFETGIAEGRIKDLPFKHVAVSLMSMILGPIFLAPVYQRVLGIEDMESFFDQREAVVVDLLLNGVKKT